MKEYDYEKYGIGTERYRTIYTKNNKTDVIQCIIILKPKFLLLLATNESWTDQYTNKLSFQFA